MKDTEILFLRAILAKVSLPLMQYLSIFSEKSACIFGKKSLRSLADASGASIIVIRSKNVYFFIIVSSSICYISRLVPFSLAKK